jgi:hypothetical protein
VKEAQDIAHEHFIIQNVYAYKHGQVAFSLASFQSRWDAGHTGWMYVSREEAEERFQKFKPAHDKFDDAVSWVYHRFEEELKAFQQFFNGNIYGYVLKKDEKRVDSCWGYFGQKYAKEDAEARAKDFV